MKKIIFTLSILAMLSCKDDSSKSSQKNAQDSDDMSISTSEDFTSFGDKIDQKNVLSASVMKEKFQNLKVGDTLAVKFESKVDKVCKKKGCWMTLKLDDSLTTFVKFKDYSFFVPLNAENRTTIVEGKAYVTETSVQELQHYAKDAGKSEEEIAAITAPEQEYAIMATGVLMQTPKAN
ncbi:DUF4920 domain-containing protein [Mesonia aestuariivivens]|uniref:DUF4920 domain-containing protein n=1 Tax=Mesonia aestuariivivens TaxID=2796128 RepID=A0ABS6W3X6_9FLAO|nr:DUF4920 domain-containing protein [Mesonia aestuariivivens]MBW2962571.1 DUF4920 domain-containing protein [Mesonia aestuariivivens]